MKGAYSIYTLVLHSESNADIYTTSGIVICDIGDAWQILSQKYIFYCINIPLQIVRSKMLRIVKWYDLQYTFCKPLNVTGIHAYDGHSLSCPLNSNSYSCHIHGQLHNSVLHHDHAAVIILHARLSEHRKWCLHCCEQDVKRQ